MTTATAGWQVRVSGPDDAEKTVLLIPGSLCTAAFYADLQAERSLAGVRLVAATMPGQGGTPPPAECDVGVEGYARLAAKLAADLGCDAIVGHSTGANIALEMAAGGQFHGPIVLMAPSLSRVDESLVPRVLDKLSRVLGTLPLAGALKIIGPMMRKDMPSETADLMIADLRRNDPRIIREHMRLYLGYLDRYGSVAARLCESGVPAWVVYGERDDVGITDAERRTLADCPRVTVVTLADTGHMIPQMRPAETAELVHAALAAADKQP